LANDVSSYRQVDREELKEAFRFLRLELKATEFESLFRFLDASGNGTIEQEELEVVSARIRFPTTDTTASAFCASDRVTASTKTNKRRRRRRP
jgi:Ca2+-binding EF-hand superfamily protein